MRAVAAAVLLGLAAPAAAAAAPPVNDAPAGAIEFTAFGAGNLPEGGTAAERQGLVDLGEATADAGVPRCLGATSFARTVWFRVPAGPVPRLVRVEASSPSGGTSEIPDLALFVGGPAGPSTAEPQSCDGPAVGPLMTSAAAVEARVPAGRDVLIQVGRSGGQAESRVIASLRTADLPATPPPLGDAAAGAPAARLNGTTGVALPGATLTEEDPAQPACPAAATVWRRTRVAAAGVYRITVRGPAVGAVTAFAGATPTADGARACVNRTSAGGVLVLPVRLRRGATLLTRLGTDNPADGASASVKIEAPRARLRIGRVVRGRGRLRVRVRAQGRPARAVRVSLERRTGKRFRRVTRRVALPRIGAGRTRTVRVRYTLAPGRYRIVADGRAGTRRLRTTKRLRVRP